MFQTMSNSTEVVYDKESLSYYFSYDPNEGGNLFFAISFFIFTVILLFQAIQTRKAYVGIMVVFAACEGVGFILRTVMVTDETNLYNKYLAQIIILILSPNFAQAYMYTETSELIKWSSFHAESWFKRYGPNLPSYFILTDFICLVIQGIAGGTMANKDASKSSLDAAKATILAGLALQLFSLFVFVFVVALFLYNCERSEYEQIKKYVVTLSSGIMFMIIRNVYRVAEYEECESSTDGAMNKSEAYLFVLDAMCMWIVCLLLVAVPVCYLQERESSNKQAPNKVTDIEMASPAEEKKGKKDYAVVQTQDEKM